MSLPFANAAMDYLVRVNVSLAHQGKAWGLISLISQAGYVLAYALTGVAVDFIIKPFLQKEGNAAKFALNIPGRGEGRGAALMIIIAAVFLMFIALTLPRKSEIRELEEENVLEIA